MRRLEIENILGTIEEMKEVKRQAMQVSRYTEGQGPKTENLKSAILLKKMIILDEILVESFDGMKIVPFSLLDERKKQGTAPWSRTRSSACSASTTPIAFPRSLSTKLKRPSWTNLLRSAYPFISEGRRLTTGLAQLVVPIDLKVLPKYLPEGEEDSAAVVIGQLGEKPLIVKIWKDGRRAICSFGFSSKIAGEEEITIQITDTGWKRINPVWPLL